MLWSCTVILPVSCAWRRMTITSWFVRSSYTCGRHKVCRWVYREVFDKRGDTLLSFRFSVLGVFYVYPLRDLPFGVSTVLGERTLLRYERSLVCFLYGPLFSVVWVSSGHNETVSSHYKGIPSNRSLSEV